jgi:hypothetical protein
MRLRIGVIFARHGHERYPDALPKLDDFYRHQLPNAVRTTIVVDNALPRSAIQLLDSDTLLIGGDNSHWEFSAWDRGLAHLDRMRVSVDLVHFVTSAFDTLYTEFITRFDEALLCAAAAADAAVGHIDHYNEPTRIFGHDNQHWIRSSFFFLTPPGVHALHSMVCCEDTEGIFSDDPAHPFEEASPLSENFRKLVLDWLTGEGTGQDVTWHSRFDLDRKTLPYFKQKARAILNESMLSVRIRKLGYPMVDASWLASQLADCGPSRVDWQEPWQVQLATRMR